MPNEATSFRQPDGDGRAAVALPSGRGCVYTVLLGRYEKLNEQPAAKISSLPFICFTDDPDLVSETWTTRPIKGLFESDAVRSQRAIKLMPHRFLPDFDYSLYIDNTVILHAPPERVIESHFEPGVLALFLHSERGTLREEFEAVASMHLDDKSRLAEQLLHYRQNHEEVLAEPPFWSGILLRDHRDEKLRTMAELWRDHVLRYSRRDQLSLNVALSQCGIIPKVIPGGNANSWFHTWPHTTDRRERTAWDAAAPAPSPDSIANRNLVVALEEEAARLRQERDELQGALAAIHQSKSWRVTAPLRGLSLRLRTATHWLEKPKLNRQASSPGSLAQGTAIATLSDKRADAAHFASEGYLAPVRLFTKAQCDLILRHARLGARPALETGAKDLAAKDRFFLDLAGRPQILERLRLLLGENVDLWGASLVERPPGARHLFHTDIESASPKGGFVTLWVGLENTTEASSLQLITRSHKLGRSLQEETHRQGFRRGQVDPPKIVAWARRSERQAELIQADMRDGDGLFIDGRLWHGSHNSSEKTRTALLLQYVRAGVPVTIHEVGNAEWPFRMTKKSPTLLPVMRAGQPVRNHPSVPLVEPTTKDGSVFAPGPEGWATYPILRGATPNTSTISSHASVLSPGHSPHEPHCHAEEEILIVLDGDAEVLIAASPDPTGARVERLTAGAFAYYPAYQFHTIRNVSDRPVTYLMYKWQGPPQESETPLATQVFDIKPVKFPPSNRPFAMQRLFEAPTGYLSKLHAHVTEIAPGGGYAAHADAHDVGLVVFDGEVETLGRRLGPGGSAFSPGGTLHGLHNPEDRPARYLVFEFHR